MLFVDVGRPLSYTATCQLLEVCILLRAVLVCIFSAQAPLGARASPEIPAASTATGQRKSVSNAAVALAVQRGGGCRRWR